MARLNYFKHNQQTIRSDKYKCIRDAILSDQTSDMSQIGKHTILPSSFTGGPRHMNQLFQVAMACIRLHGKPDLFVTFTANPKWPEIMCELDKRQVLNDRPDHISRVFRLKLRALLNDILESQIFGKIMAHIYVIEWQKMGLPHAHILLCLEDVAKITNVNQVDHLVNAEIPDKSKHKLAFETVSSSMMHGPCGIGYRNAPCMKERRCSKGLPKEFRDEIISANDKQKHLTKTSTLNAFKAKEFIYS